MKLCFEKEELLAGITPAMSAVSEKNTLTAIEGILFQTKGSDCCLLSSYDLEKGFRISVPCQVSEEGSFIIGAAKLFRIVRMMPDRYVRIEADGKGMAKISSGRSEFRMPALPGEDFPNLPELSGEKGFTLASGLLRDTIGQIQHAIGTGESRPVLTGAFFRMADGGLKVVACDGYRLALREKKCEVRSKGLDREDGMLSFIVPGKTLAELMRMLPQGEEPVTLEFGRKHVIFLFENKLFFSRLIDGEYIPYERIIPKNNHIRVRLDREAFADSLERARLVTDDRSFGQARSYVKCNFEGDKLKISSSSSMSSVYDEIEIEKEGEDLLIGFDCHYLLDALRAIDDEEILITLSTPLMSITIEGSFEEEPDADADASAVDAESGSDADPADGGDAPAAEGKNAGSLEENGDEDADKTAQKGEKPRVRAEKYLYMIGPVKMKE